MIYTEEMKRKINSAGFQVLEIKYFIKRFVKIVESLAQAIRKTIEQIYRARSCY